MAGMAVSKGPLKVLIILAHPRGHQSLCGALADAFAEGACETGCAVTRLSLDQLLFDPNVNQPSPRDHTLEPDLESARRALEKADHVVFVYPTWWGTGPALLKGFLDRVLVPGWAFEEIAGGTGFAGLLNGRTAELVTTMDTPGPVYSLIYRAPGRNAMARATLGFCGIDVTRHTRFGPVNTSVPAQRSKWLRAARNAGLSLGDGPHSCRQRVWRRAKPWLIALRLQFYPMSFFAYWIGALLATRETQLDTGSFWLGYGLLFALEAATVFSNDLCDRKSDQQNALWGPFNGGSRVLHEGLLTPASLRRGVVFALFCAALAGVVLVAMVHNGLVLVPFLLVSAVLALGYTMPPLRLSYRTLGEIDVGLTHSFMAILFGHLVQGGAFLAPAPWLVSLPLFLSILPAIVLSGVPDHDADKTVGKRTVAVAYGVGVALRISAVLAPAATAAMLVVDRFGVPGVYGLPVSILTGAHAVWLVMRLSREPPRARRIDATMVVALGFIMWFCIPPLWRLA